MKKLRLWETRWFLRIKAWDSNPECPILKQVLTATTVLPCPPLNNKSEEFLNSHTVPCLMWLKSFSPHKAMWDRLPGRGGTWTWMWATSPEWTHQPLSWAVRYGWKMFHSDYLTSKDDQAWAEPRRPRGSGGTKGSYQRLFCREWFKQDSHDPMLNSLTEAPSLAPTPQSKSKQRLCACRQASSLAIVELLWKGAMGSRRLKEIQRGVSGPWELLRVVGIAPSLGRQAAPGLQPNPWSLRLAGCCWSHGPSPFLWMLSLIWTASSSCHASRENIQVSLSTSSSFSSHFIVVAQLTFVPKAMHDLSVTGILYRHSRKTWDLEQDPLLDWEDIEL